MIRGREIKYEVDFVKGSMHGHITVWRDNGCIWWEGWYDHGKLHGLYRTYYEDESVCTEVVYENEVLEGERIDYER